MLTEAVFPRSKPHTTNVLEVQEAVWHGAPSDPTVCVKLTRPKFRPRLEMNSSEVDGKFCEMDVIAGASRVK